MITGTGSLTDLQLSTPIDSQSNIDVYTNGLWLREGTDWQRTVGNNTIQLLDDGGPTRDAVSGELIIANIFSGINKVDEHFNTTSSNLTVGEVIEESTRIDVYYQGWLLIEGEDFSRNAPSNRVDLNFTPKTTENITVRVWS